MSVTVYAESPAFTITAPSSLPTPDWDLPLNEDTGTTASATEGPNGTYVGAVQLGVGSIVDGDSDPGIGLSGLLPAPPHVTVTSPISGPDFTLSFHVQLDNLDQAKHVLVATDGSSHVDGQFSIEVLAGGQMRAWSRVGGSARVITGSVGNLSQGMAARITYQRQSSDSDWSGSQRLLVDGAQAAVDPTQAAWDAVPTGTVYVGTWWDGSTFVAPMDGVIKRIRGWDSILSSTELAELAASQSVAWAEDFDAGQVVASSSTAVSVLQKGWHGRTPVVASASDGSLVTTTESADQVTIVAGATTGSDAFDYSFTDANSNTSPTATMTVAVVGEVQELKSRYLFDLDTMADEGPAGVDGSISGTFVATDLDPIAEGASGHSFFKYDNNNAAYLKIPADAAHTYTTGATIRVQFQPITMAKRGIILSIDGGSPHPPGDLGLECWGAEGSYLTRAWITDETGATQYADSTSGVTGFPLTKDVAHSLELVFTGSAVLLYVDQVLAWTWTGLTVMPNFAVDAILGVWARDRASGPFAGALQTTEIWNYALDGTEIAALPPPNTITTPSPPAVQGIQLPTLGYQSISDSVPAGSIWWDPTNGSDSNDGSTKALAKKTFAAAEALASTTKRIILAGGAAGSTTYHKISSAITPTKSGTDASHRMELYAEPDCTVVLVRDGDWVGGLDGSWAASGWTVIDADKKIYECPESSHGDGATAINFTIPNTTGSNWLQGILEIPNGPLGRTYFMAVPWVRPSEIANAGGDYILNGGYDGPWMCFTSSGKIRICLRPPTAAYASNEWPTDGIMGGLIGPDGVWQEPNGTPEDYRLHITRVPGSGDYGASKTYECFNFSGRSWWHVRGINTDLCTGAVTIGNGSNGIWLDHMTRFSTKHDIMFEGQFYNLEDTYGQAITGDWRMHSWKEYKTGPYWSQHARTSSFYGHGGFTGAATATFTDYTMYGWFDAIYPADLNTPISFKYDHCAFLNIVDDGMSQDACSGKMELEWDHCLSWGGPPFSGGGGAPDSGTDEWYIHDSVIYCGLPELWNSVGFTGNWGNPGDVGIAPNNMWPHRQDGWRPQKMYNCTVITCGFGGNQLGAGIDLNGADLNYNLASEWQHEVYNCIFAFIGTEIYSDPNTLSPPNRGDWLVQGYNCKQSAAGTFRWDYNCYHWGGSWTRYCPMFLNMCESYRLVNPQSFNSLAAWRASSLYTMSASMYSDGTAGHEQHGMEADPQFVDFLALDFRPQNAALATGAKNLSSTGWPGAGNPGYIGAIDPSGDGSEVGPRTS